MNIFEALFEEISAVNNLVYTPGDWSINDVQDVWDEIRVKLYKPNEYMTIERLSELNAKIDDVIMKYVPRYFNVMN